MSDDPAVVVASDGTVRYRASALGSCTRALAALRQEYASYEAPEKIRNVFAAGHAAEEIGYAAIAARGGRVEGKQDEVRLTISSRISVVGHIDGVLNRHVLELKSQGDAEWNEDYESWGLWDKYAWQLSAYMIGRGMPAYLMQVRRSDGKTVMHEILTPPHSLEEIRKRVLTVEYMAVSDINTLKCDRNDYPCPVFYTHDKVERELLTDSALEALVHEHERARLDARRANDRRTKAKDAILEVIGIPAEVGDTTRHRVGDFNLTASKYHKKGFTIKERDEVRLTITEVNDDAEQVDRGVAESES